MNHTIKQNRRNKKQYKCSSIRLQTETWDTLTELARKSCRSRTVVMRMLLEYGLASMETDKVLHDKILH